MINLKNCLSGIISCIQKLLNKYNQHEIIIYNLVSYGKIKYDTTEYLNGNITGSINFDGLSGQNNYYVYYFTNVNSNGSLTIPSATINNLQSGQCFTYQVWVDIINTIDIVNINIPGKCINYPSQLSNQYNQHCFTFRIYNDQNNNLNTLCNYEYSVTR